MKERLWKMEKDAEGEEKMEVEGGREGEGYSWKEG
jgi:hypothetical protein